MSLVKVENSKLTAHDVVNVIISLNAIILDDKSRKIYKEEELTEMKLKVMEYVKYL